MKILNLYRAFVITLTLLTLAPVAFAPTSVMAGPSVSIAAAIDLHNAARDGDKDATPKAVESFTALMAKDPNNAIIVAYLGSSYAIYARDSGAVADKIRYTNRGLRFLDQAVTMAPADFSVRMIRSSVTANLPSMFGRADSAVEDFIALDKMFSAVQSPKMAPAMIDVYTQLAELAPEQADWDTKLNVARAIAKGN